MADKLFAFLVSADEEWISLHKERLGREFDLNVYRTERDCRSALADTQPQLLILDTALPGGFALHREIRDDFMTGDIYQLLLCTEDEAAHDYFVADDFLVKPFPGGVFWKKLALIRKLFEDKASARDQLGYAQGVALTAMSSMGELGVVMQFLSHSFSCTSLSAVADLALDALRQYELAGVIHFIWEGEQLTATTDGLPPQESQRELIAQYRLLGRLLEIDKNMIVNFDHVSILITNMPDDPQHCGRIRDNLATLAEGVESRIQGLLLEHDVLLKQQGIRYAVYEVRDSVRHLILRQMEDTKSSRDLVNSVIDEYEDAFTHMGVALELENKLIAHLVTLRQRITAIVSQPGMVHDKLQITIQSLETLAGQTGVSD